MSDQYRDSCVDRQNKNRKTFKGKPNDEIRVSFYDKDMMRVNDVTRSEANCIASLNPPQLFYYQDGNGYQRELLIDQVNALSILDALPDGPACPTDPQLCGPPRVQIFGGMGMGAMANAVISPVSSSVIGFDIVNPGFNYSTPPFANIVDECGSGSGSTLKVQTQPYGTATTTAGTGGATTTAGTGGATTTAGTGGATTTAGTGGVVVENAKGGLEIKNIVVTSPGDGYLSAPNGSLGGNGRIWKDVGEAYVERDDGSYYVVPSGKEPPNLPPEDKFIPPQPPTELDPNIISYPVVTEIEEIFVDDPGFGYEPGDTLEVISNDGTNKGAVLEPVINGRGEIAQVKVIKPGIGFIDLPEIVVNSPRGYNAKLIPVLKVTPIADIPDPTFIPPGTQLISVVDCVGKIAPKDTFDIVPR
jgi:hypothetical protein